MKEWIEKGKKKELISLMKNKFSVLFILGIFLIAISYIDMGEKKIEPAPKEEQNTVDYATQLEEKVQKMLNGIDGISNVKVMITLKSSSEKVIKEDVESEKVNREEGTEINQEIHYKRTTAVFSGEEEVPYVLKEITPEVEGIAISAKGVYEAKRKNEIIGMMVALFDLPLHKISIMES